jgi:hypothetical protein
MPLEDFLTPKRPKDAIAALVVLALILLAIAIFFGLGSTNKNIPGVGVTSAGFAIAGALIISAAVRLYGDSRNDHTP